MRLSRTDEYRTLDELREHLFYRKTRVKKVDYEPLWKKYYLAQHVPKLVGIEGIGLIDIDPDDLFKKVEKNSKDSIRRFIFNGWQEQIYKGGTTIGYNLDRMMEWPEIGQYAERVLELRQKEIEQVVIHITRENHPINLKALCLTEYGVRILEALGMPWRCSKDELNRLKTALGDSGIHVEMINDQSKYTASIPLHEYPVNISIGLAQCIWAVTWHKAFPNLGYLW